MSVDKTTFQASHMIRIIIFVCASIFLLQQEKLKMKKITLVMTCALVLSACAGRAPAPVAVVQPIDATMDCTAIQAETAANTARIADLGSESGAKVAQNVAMGVAGLIIWPLWFAMDFQGSAGIDQRALETRNQYLTTLAGTRRAPPPQIRS